MAPRGTSMVGGARTVEGIETVGYEHLRIEVDGDRLVYVAAPSGQAETRFAQVELGLVLAPAAEEPHNGHMVRERDLARGRFAAVGKGQCRVTEVIGHACKPSPPTSQRSTTGLCRQNAVIVPIGRGAGTSPGGV